MNINDFEQKLMNLTPAEPDLDPAAASYEAGFRQGLRNVRIWQVSSSCMALLVVLFAFFDLKDNQVQPGPEMANSNIQFAMEDQTGVDFDNIKFEIKNIGNTPKVPDANSYLLLRRRVLDKGLDVLPKSSGKKSKVYSLKDLLNS